MGLEDNTATTAQPSTILTQAQFPAPYGPQQNCWVRRWRVPTVQGGLVVPGFTGPEQWTIGPNAQESLVWTLDLLSTTYKATPSLFSELKRTCGIRGLLHVVLSLMVPFYIKLSSSLLILHERILLDKLKFENWSIKELVFPWTWFLFHDGPQVWEFRARCESLNLIKQLPLPGLPFRADLCSEDMSVFPANALMTLHVAVWHVSSGFARKGISGPGYRSWTITSLTTQGFLS